MNLCVCSYHSQCDVICVTLGGVEGVVLSQHVLNNRVFDLLWGSAAGKSNATSCLFKLWLVGHLRRRHSLGAAQWRNGKRGTQLGRDFFSVFSYFFNNIKISFLLVFGRLKVS